MCFQNVVVYRKLADKPDDLDIHMMRFINLILAILGLALGFFNIQVGFHRLGDSERLVLSSFDHKVFDTPIENINRVHKYLSSLYSL